MSALAVMLSAALVAGNAPAKVSTETRQVLDLHGEWEGVWQQGRTGKARPVSLSRTRMSYPTDQGPIFVDDHHIIDEGDNRLRVKGRLPGIYQQNGDRLIICYGEAGDRRPTSFQATGEQSILILHRRRPRK